MKKLFTLVAFLAMVLGAKAETQWEEVYKIDYTTLQSFPFYVMGYVPEFGNGCMTDLGAAYRYATQADLDGDGDAKWKDGETSEGTAMAGNTEYQRVTGAGPYWHQYIIANGVPMLLDETYKVKAVVKATEAVNANLQFGNWGALKETGVSIPEGSDFQEAEWIVEGCMYGGDGFICIQPGTSTATIEWKSLVVYHKMKEGQRPKVWLEDIENGDASKTWAELGLADVKFNDQENNFKVCAWSKERMVNPNDDGGWDPFPANIEEDPNDASNKVFVCHGKAAITEGDAAAWDNQFWIQSKHSWPAGTTLKISFKYKASKEVTCQTQIHKQNPSDYLIWHAIGDISFTENWQTFEKDVTFGDDMNGGWSVAFNLNSSDKNAIDFYFDDLSWKYLKLDEGYFVSGVNVTVNPNYDNLDNAIPFAEGVDFDDAECLVATVGTKGDSNTYVDQIMISTKRGDDQAFKGATLKPVSKITAQKDWGEFTTSSNAKIDLPGLGVWTIYLDTEYSTMAVEMLEGTPYDNDPVEVFTYTDEITVNGKERDDLKDDKNADTGAITVREEADDPAGVNVGGEGHEGQTWDNQFFIKANHKLEKGTVTKLVFKYKASVAEAKTTTQCHGENPGAYMHWAAIGDVVFTDEWQDFEQEFTVPNEADGMWNIAFNMAEIKEACDYSIKDVQWYLYDASLDAGLTYENLISGSANFYKKEGAGTDPYTGIENVTVKNAKTSNAIYNLAGQRVSKDYKGLVIKDGKKFVK